MTLTEPFCNPTLSHMNRNNTMDWSTTQFSRATLLCKTALSLHVLNLCTIMGLFTGKIHQGPHALYPYLIGAPTHLSPLKRAPPTFALN